MTIDMHCHLLVEEFNSENYVAPFWNPGAHQAEDPEAARIEAKKRTGTRIHTSDPEGRDHLKRMDEAGIEKAILLHLDKGLLFGDGPVSIEEQNRHVSRVAEKNPDRFVWFCGIDPRRKNAVPLLEQCVTEWGAKGIKLYPTTGFLPADKACYPFYERAQTWQIPIYFHMGPENPPYYNQGNAHAAVLLRVLVDFPDLTIIVAHLGFEFWRDLLALGKVRDNVMCDFCAWQPIAQQRHEQFRYILRKFLDEFGAHRVLFGTDAPILEKILSSRDFIGILKNLPQQTAAGTPFTEAEVEAVLAGNARRLLASIPDRTPAFPS
jgi:predicted TIM-barrel fold metal-dependent hydrolase